MSLRPSASGLRVGRKGRAGQGLEQLGPCKVSLPWQGCDGMALRPLPAQTWDSVQFWHSLKTIPGSTQSANADKPFPVPLEELGLAAPTAGTECAG